MDRTAHYKCHSTFQREYNLTSLHIVGMLWSPRKLIKSNMFLFPNWVMWTFKFIVKRSNQGTWQQINKHATRLVLILCFHKVEGRISTLIKVWQNFLELNLSGNNNRYNKGTRIPLRLMYIQHTYVFLSDLYDRYNLKHGKKPLFFSKIRFHSLVLFFQKCNSVLKNLFQF